MLFGLSHHFPPDIPTITIPSRSHFTILSYKPLPLHSSHFQACNDDVIFWHDTIKLYLTNFKILMNVKLCRLFKRFCVRSGSSILILISRSTQPYQPFGLFLKVFFPILSQNVSVPLTSSHSSVSHHHFIHMSFTQFNPTDILLFDKAFWA